MYASEYLTVLYRDVLQVVDCCVDNLENGWLNTHLARIGSPWKCIKVDNTTRVVLFCKLRTILK